MRFATGLPAAAALVLALFSPAQATDTEATSTPYAPTPNSLGQPSQNTVLWGPMIGWGFEEGEFASRLFVDLIRQKPVGFMGPLDAMFEGAMGTTGPNVDGFLGGYLGVSLLRLGVEYNFHDNGFAFGLTSQIPLHRGGLFGVGDQLRVDFRPARQEILVGLSFHSPFYKYRHSRPRKKEVSLPSGRTPNADSGEAAAWSDTLEKTLEAITHRIIWLDRYTTPSFEAGEAFEASAGELRKHSRIPGHTISQEDSAYHSELQAAFTLAFDGDEELGREVALLAESVLLNQVLIPYNQKFGRLRDPHHPGGYCEIALQVFADTLSLHHAFDEHEEETPPREWLASKEIFRRVLEQIESAAHAARARWRETFLFWDRRAQYVWLPLNYGVRFEDYDTQLEWDSLLSALSETPFTDANAIEYLMFEQFHLQLKQMIRETDRYQVTIVHDFRGKDGNGNTDIYGWDMVADGYLAGFTQAIAEIDGGERTQLPQFHLFLDKHYYNQNDSRQIITFLENLYEPGKLKLESDDIQEQVMLAQQKMRAAIDSSPTFSNLDPEQLASIFKVNVNITFPDDPTYAFDITMRDHRKLAFRDVFESDPASGEAVITGQGIGAHYNGSGWEDRSILVRGSSLVQLKDETREVFLSQGFHEDEIPEYLRAMPYPDDYQERCEALREEGWTTPISIPMNATGYGYKHASVLKAAMYNLAFKESNLLLFDSLWLSDFWAGMAVGAALRGCRVLPIAPTRENAPSNGTPTLYYLRENLDRLFQAQIYLDEEIARAGGALRVGLYNHDVRINDLGKRIKTFVEGRHKYEFLREMFPFDPRIEGYLMQKASEYEEVSLVELRLRSRPKLHLKNQLFGTKEAFRGFGLAEWGPVLNAHTIIREKQLHGIRNEGLTPKVLETPMPQDSTWNLLRAYEIMPDDADPGSNKKSFFTFIVGSHNQNPRSLLLDGEVTVTVSGVHCLVSAIDFMFLAGVSSWPNTREEFDELFPVVKPSAPSKWFYGLIKDIH